MKERVVAPTISRFDLRGYRHLFLGAFLACVPWHVALATDVAPGAERFVPQAPSAPEADRFIPNVPVIPREAFIPYVDRLAPAERTSSPDIADTATRFVPHVDALARPQIVSPADMETPVQRFIPTTDRLPEVEKIYP